MISPMARIFFHESPLLIFPVIALLIFVGVFILITVRALRADNASIKYAAALPLLDDELSLRANTKQETLS